MLKSTDMCKKPYKLKENTGTPEKHHNHETHTNWDMLGGVILSRKKKNPHQAIMHEECKGV